MTSTESAIHLGKVLRALAVKVQDARTGGKEARLGVAVGVISDLGQFMTTASPTEVRTIQAKVAAVREKLRYGDDAVTNRPSAILDDYKNNQMFLSGALWAADEFLEAHLRATTSASEPKASQRGALRDVIVQRVRNTGTATPKDCIDEARRRGLQIRPDQVSRALGDLMREGTVVSAEAPHDGDRRNRYFKLAELVKPSTRKSPGVQTASNSAN